MHTEAVLTVLKNLQNQICAALEQEDGGAVFAREEWTGKLGVGETRVLKNGAVFEQTGVNFSHVKGNKMPASSEKSICADQSCERALFYRVSGGR